MSEEFLKKPYGFLKLIAMILSLLCAILYAVVEYSISVLGWNFSTNYVLGYYSAVYGELKSFAAALCPFSFGSGMLSCLFILLAYGCDAAEKKIPLMEMVFGFVYAILHVISGGLVLASVGNTSGSYYTSGLLLGTAAIVAALVYLVDGILAVMNK